MSYIQVNALQRLSSVELRLLIHVGFKIQAMQQVQTKGSLCEGLWNVEMKDSCGPTNEIALLAVFF